MTQNIDGSQMFNQRYLSGKFKEFESDVMRFFENINQYEKNSDPLSEQNYTW